MVEAINLERVMGDPDFKGIAFLELALAALRYVGRVHVRSSPTRSTSFGTSFMVSPRLFITNNHVLSSSKDARHTEVELDFQHDCHQRRLPLPPLVLRLDIFFPSSSISRSSRSRGRRATDDAEAL